RAQHSHTLRHTQAYTHIYTRTTLSLSLSHTHTLTQTQTNARIHTHTLQPSVTHACLCSRCSDLYLLARCETLLHLGPRLSHTHFHSHTHTHTHTLTPVTARL